MSTASARRLPQFSLVVKPAGSFCNLRCDYCFYLDKHSLYPGQPAAHRMSAQTLDKVIAEMFALADAPTFIWHGGEPALMGLDFFEQAVRVQRQHANGRTYANALQSNGTLLDERWADFLKRENFLVGISLDGPEQLHDRHRRDLQGRGTFQRVFANARMLLEKGVPVNVMAAVSGSSVGHVEEIYNFFKRNGFIFMQFMPVVESDPQQPDSAAPYSVNARDYGLFLHRLFRLWLEDFDFRCLRQQTSIRFFDDLIKIYAGLMPDHCIFQRICGNALVVEHNGDLFSCDYLVSDDTRIGNIHSMSLKAALDSRAHRAFGQRKAAIGLECEQCRWLDLCYGGCIKDRIRDPLDKGRNHFCASYKFFFARADKHLKRLAELHQQHYQN